MVRTTIEKISSLCTVEEELHGIIVGSKKLFLYICVKSKTLKIYAKSFRSPLIFKQRDGCCSGIIAPLSKRLNTGPTDFMVGSCTALSILPTFCIQKESIDLLVHIRVVKLLRRYLPADLLDHFMLHVRQAMIIPQHFRTSGYVIDLH